MRPDAAQIPKVSDPELDPADHIQALKALLMSAYGGTDDEKSAQFEKDVTAYTADIDTPGTVSQDPKSLSPHSRQKDH